MDDGGDDDFFDADAAIAQEDQYRDYGNDEYDEAGVGDEVPGQNIAQRAAGGQDEDFSMFMDDDLLGNLNTQPQAETQVVNQFGLPRALARPPVAATDQRDGQRSNRAPTVGHAGPGKGGNAYDTPSLGSAPSKEQLDAALRTPGEVDAAAAATAAVFEDGPTALAKHAAALGSDSVDAIVASKAGTKKTGKSKAGKGDELLPGGVNPAHVASSLARGRSGAATAASAGARLAAAASAGEDPPASRAAPGCWLPPGKSLQSYLLNRPPGGSGDDDDGRGDAPECIEIVLPPLDSPATGLLPADAYGSIPAAGGGGDAPTNAYDGGSMHFLSVDRAGFAASFRGSGESREELAARTRRPAGGRLLSTPIARIINKLDEEASARALAEIQRADRIASGADDDAGPGFDELLAGNSSSSNNKSGSSSSRKHGHSSAPALWVDKYAPHGYLDLLSSDAQNRAVSTRS